MKKFLALLEREFDKNLSSKTGWGRNEIKDQFQRAIVSALIETGNLNDLEPLTPKTIKKPVELFEDASLNNTDLSDSPF